MQAIALVALAVQVFCVVMCFVKGRAVLGVIGVFVAPVAWVGALLPAKPVKVPPPVELLPGEANLGEPF